MADSLARDMADHFRPAWDASKRSQISDGSANPLSLCRPGFRVAADRDLDARQRLYDQADHELANRWRGADAENNEVIAEGGVCTVGNQEYPLDAGAPGHLKLGAGRVVCLSDNQRSPRNAVNDHAAMMAQLCDQADQELSTGRQIVSLIGRRAEVWNAGFSSATSGASRLILAGNRHNVGLEPSNTNRAR
jgi:hypothetical protein